jgi:hypothetical protein
MGSKAELPNLLSASAGFFLGLLFDRKDGDDMFLRNVRPSPNCKAPKLRKQYSS